MTLGLCTCTRGMQVLTKNNAQTCYMMKYQIFKMATITMICIGYGKDISDAKRKYTC